ncbi:hypothetical protein BOO29_11965 [Vibrio navarrensis]|uniref:hypothetical protein n=1 Tax=Vibrio navarrensis TaxID=29495 RepID=UPI0018699313|nr:hypothetical protein [Vibrio navarrensis]MBE4585672.1 hypothetical protein [Vibrio navarrensis]
MFQVSLPIGMLISPFVEKISQWMFLESLNKSNEQYLEWKGVFEDWDKVSDEVEVSVYSPNVLDNDRAPLTKIAIKTNNGTVLNSVELLIQGKSGPVKYQDILKVYNVDSVPTVISAPSIPLRSFHIEKNGNYYSTLDSISIQRLDIEPEQKSYKAVTRYSNTELLNDRFVKKWDVYWNMRAIDSACDDIYAKLNYHLVQPKILFANPDNISKAERLKELIRFLVGRPLFFILGFKFMIKIYFWLPIILKLKKFELKDC